MSRRTTLVLIAAVVLAGAVLFALTARNDFCLPWQERVSYGDGAFGPQDDFSACR